MKPLIVASPLDPVLLREGIYLEPPGSRLNQFTLRVIQRGHMVAFDIAPTRNRARLLVDYLRHHYPTLDVYEVVIDEDAARAIAKDCADDSPTLDLLHRVTELLHDYHHYDKGGEEHERHAPHCEICQTLEEARAHYAEKTNHHHK